MQDSKGTDVIMATPESGPSIAAELSDLERKVDHICNLCSTWSVGEEFEKEIKEKVAQLEDEISPRISSLLSETDRKKKAFAHYLAGKLALVLGTLEEAEESLTKGVKRDITLHRAWAYLGDIYMQREKYDVAYEFLHKAIEDKTHHVAFRLLSQLVRLILKVGSPSIKETIDDAVEYARVAVSLSTDNTTSWQLLGNAFLDQYFTKVAAPSGGSESLRAALQAYLMAEKNLGKDEKNPDLSFNEAVVYKYIGNYALALKKFYEAVSLDHTLPTQSKVDDIHRLMRNVKEWKNGTKGARQQKFLAKQSAALGAYAWDKEIVGGKVVRSRHGQFEGGANEYKECKNVVVAGTLIDFVSADGRSPHGVFIVGDSEGDISVFVLEKVDLTGFRAGEFVAIIEPRVCDMTMNSSFEDMAHVGAVEVKVFMASEVKQVLKNNERILPSSVRVPKLKSMQPSTPGRARKEGY